jgi:hypothetical protein
MPRQLNKQENGTPYVLLSDEWLRADDGLPTVADVDENGTLVISLPASPAQKLEALNLFLALRSASALPSAGGSVAERLRGLLD